MWRTLLALLASNLALYAHVPSLHPWQQMLCTVVPQALSGGIATKPSCCTCRGRPRAGGAVSSIQAEPQSRGCCCGGEAVESELQGPAQCKAGSGHSLGGPGGLGLQGGHSRTSSGFGIGRFLLCLLMLCCHLHCIVCWKGYGVLWLHSTL